MLDFAAVAGALVDAPCAWLSEPAIAAVLGAPRAELAVAIAGLVAGRLLDRWDRPDGPVVILTALGARQLGVRLVEVPGAELYRWSDGAASVRSTRPSRRDRADARSRRDLAPAPGPASSPADRRRPQAARALVGRWPLALGRAAPPPAAAGSPLPGMFAT